MRDINARLAICATEAPLILMLFALAVFGGCYNYSQFRPIDEENPIVIFDRYQIEIYGSAAGDHWMRIDVGFLRPPSDTMQLDTIPILVLDSVCFIGECLEGDFCLRPRTDYEQCQDNYRRGMSADRSASFVRGHDLSLTQNGEPRMGSFLLDDDYTFPERCDNLDLRVAILFRLLDRVSGAEIARESRMLQFRIKRGRYLQLLS